MRFESRNAQPAKDELCKQRRTRQARHTPHTFTRVEKPHRKLFDTPVRMWGNNECATVHDLFARKGDPERRSAGEMLRECVPFRERQCKCLRRYAREKREQCIRRNERHIAGEIEQRRRGIPRAEGATQILSAIGALVDELVDGAPACRVHLRAADHGNALHARTAERLDCKPQKRGTPKGGKGFDRRAQNAGKLAVNPSASRDDGAIVHATLFFRETTEIFDMGGERRIRYVDGLRAVAVLLVLAHHVMLHSPALHTPVPFMSWAHVMLEGSHGVDLFFVLSGFCLSYPLLQRLRTEGSARFDVARYFAKRIVRIVPPYYAAVALLLLVPASRGGVNGLDVLKQLLFLDWHTAFLNGSFWTLCVEFRWYFFFPIALALWIRAPKAFWAIASASVMLYAITRVHAPDVGTLLPFMLGIVAADFHIRGVRIERVAFMLLPASILGALVLEQWASMPSPYGAESSIFFVQTNPGWQVAAFAFVLLAGRLKTLRGLLSIKPIVDVGLASYSIYLVHEPVVTILQSRLHLPQVQGMAMSYAAALAVGFAFWALFERPWMSGSLKARAVDLLEPPLARAALWLQIPVHPAFWETPAIQTATAVPEAEGAPV